MVLLTTTLNSEGEGNVNSLERSLICSDEFTNLDQDYMEILHEGKPVLKKRVDDRNLNLLIEPYYPMERLIILGGGHIALPLVEIAARVGFQVTVIDDRPSFANTARFPSAKTVMCESFENCFKKIKITKNDYIVIITRGHKHDSVCLRQILRRPESIYVGMIGSRRRVNVVKEELLLEGFDCDRLNRVCTPIGLPIGAATPEEISISIVAELIKRKRVDRSENCMINRSDLDLDVLVKLSEIKDEQCCIVTIISTQGSVPRGIGAKMLVYDTGQIFGSIGGGCSESAIMKSAIRLIGTGKWVIKEIDMTADAAEEEGMVCGGTMTVLLEDYSIRRD